MCAKLQIIPLVETSQVNEEYRAVDKQLYQKYNCLWDNMLQRPSHAVELYVADDSGRGREEVVDNLPDVGDLVHGE
jgi:hypothetical protein